LGGVRGLGAQAAAEDRRAWKARAHRSEMAEIARPRPLAETDDRSGFDCGRESMTQWFRRHAWANHAAGISRANVICDAAAAKIVGYVTLSSGQIERAALPKSQQRNKPDPLPATLLGQLAIHKGHQGRGYARSLLLFAALRVSRDVGSRSTYLSRLGV
jgi:GNAT superfamily N-acetyltransferase